MYPFAHAPRDGDARIADAQRFVSDVEAALGRAGAAPGLQRIGGLDRTGTAHAVVDPVGRFVDIGLGAGWWSALGPDEVAAGLLEALAAARMKAALVLLLLRRPRPFATEPAALDGAGGLVSPPDGDRMMSLNGAGDPLLPLRAARGRIADANRLIHQPVPRPATRIVAGPRGLFRLHVSGGRIERAEAGPRRPTAADTEPLAADARDALAELARDHDATLDIRAGG